MTIIVKTIHNTQNTIHNTMNTYKTIIKSILPLLLVMGMVGAAHAQSVNNTMTGTAQLVDNISINPATGDSATVDFGQVLTNVNSAIFLDPRGQSNTNVGSSASIGVFKIGGSPGTSVTVGYTTIVPMSGDDVGNTYDLSWVPKVTFNQNGAAGSSSADLANGAEINLNANDLNLFIGGNLVKTGGNVGTPFAGGTPTPDTYSGDITITVTIN